MNVFVEMKDLIVLTADRNTEAAVRGVLMRPKTIGIRPLIFDIHRHPNKDPGCLLEGIEFLGTFVRMYEHALLVFDLEGCGQEKNKSAQDIEQDMEKEFSSAEWGERAAVIVIEPELDAWVWSDSPHVEKILGWAKHSPELRAWLIEKKYLEKGMSKPSRPKEALEDALRIARKPRSSSIYADLASKVSLARCTDRAFVKMREILRRWFRE
jgi:hypothetical protein